MSNGEIADHLRISPATAKTHVAHLLTKLDAGTGCSWSSSPTRPGWLRPAA